MKFKVFLINLDTSEDRLALCKKEFEKLNVEFERVSAVYGKDLSEQDIERCYDEVGNTRKYKKPLSSGEVGCYLSHIKCWQKIVDEELDYALILEDDFILDEAFNEFKSIMPKLVNWDFIRLAFSCKNLGISKRETITNEHDLVYYRKVPINTLAQAVSLQGAKKLLNNTKRFSRPVDVDIKHYWELDINVLAIVPPLIKDRQQSESVITKISGGKGRETRTGIWRNLKYVFSYKLKMLYFNLRQPKLSKFIK